MIWRLVKPPVGGLEIVGIDRCLSFARHHRSLLLHRLESQVHHNTKSYVEWLERFSPVPLFPLHMEALCTGSPTSGQPAPARLHPQPSLPQ